MTLCGGEKNSPHEKGSPAHFVGGRAADPRASLPETRAHDVGGETALGAAPAPQTFLAVKTFKRVVPFAHLAPR